MHKSAGVMIIQAKVLDDPTTPKAVLDYVQRYFARQTIFSVDCYIAIRHLSVGHGNTPGIAPCHSCDVDYYRDGLEDVSLSSWLKANEYVFTYSKSWEDGCSGGAHYD